jgi:regulator of replication initiation timing
MENLRRDLSYCKAELERSALSIRQLQDENERLRSRLGAEEEERESVPHGVEEGQPQAKMVSIEPSF